MEQLTEVAAIRMTPSEMELLKKEAEEKHTSVSYIVREYMRQGMKNA